MYIIYGPRQRLSNVRRLCRLFFVDFLLFLKLFTIEKKKKTKKKKKMATAQRPSFAYFFCE